MPLVTAAVLAYAAGLLCGFGTSPPWSIAALGTVVVAGSRDGRSRLALIALGVAGVAAGDAHIQRTMRCAERLAATPVWILTLQSAASEGSFVRATAACGVHVRLAVVGGGAEAGASVRASGAVQGRQSVLVMTGATIQRLGRPSFAARWRQRVGRGIDAHFGADAPLVRALLIADMRELTPDVRARFAAAGLSHMLSVSGLHVGLIAAAVLLMAQMLRLGAARAELVAVALTATYVVLIGAPLPAVRAALMLGVFSLSRLVQRPTSPWAVLATGAGLPLVHPTSLSDVGYQLSVLGMIALVSAGALARRWDWLGTGGWQGTLYRSLATSVIATLFTAPLVAAVFGTVSLVAPLTNLAAVPVMAILQPALFVAALALPAPAAAQFLADACGPFLRAIEWLASAGAGLPGASILVSVDQLTLVLALVSVGALALACASRFSGRALVAAAGAWVLIAWRPIVPATSAFTELHMLDVGQGDAFALRSTRNRWVLFDAGREWEGGDAGRRTAVPYIARRGGTLRAFVLSHPHADHVGGAASVIDALAPELFYDPGYAGSSRSYRASLVRARARGVRWHRVRPGDSLVVDEAVVTFLAPDSAWADSLRDPNEASVVARVRVGQVTMLMTGDAEAGEEQWLLRHAANGLRADVLKVAHHGSRTSSTGEFLAAVRPRLALVSVGAGNMYGHPSRAVVRSLSAQGAVVLRSDLHGTVVVRTDGRRIEVETHGERWALR